MSYIFNAEDPYGNSPEANRRRIVRALMRPPQDVGSGLAMMGDAIAYRARQNNPFPKAPGNSPFTGIGRIFGMFGKPGLY